VTRAGIVVASDLTARTAAEEARGSHQREVCVLGRIAPGHRASFVRADEALVVHNTWIDGSEAG
jgi:N-acetylglucosamine-6-phosphate deacetylase